MDEVNSSRGRKETDQSETSKKKEGVVISGAPRERAISAAASGKTSQNISRNGGKRKPVSVSRRSCAKNQREGDLTILFLKEGWWSNVCSRAGHGKIV